MFDNLDNIVEAKEEIKEEPIKEKEDKPKKVYKPRAPKEPKIDIEKLKAEIIAELKAEALESLFSDYDIDAFEETIRTAESAYKNRPPVGVKKYIVHARKILENKIKK